MKIDTVKTGAITGLIGPLLGFWVYYFMQKAAGLIPYTAIGYIKMIADNPKLLSPVLSLSLIFNLILFFFLLWRNHEKAAKGVLLATFIYAPVVLLLKFIYGDLGI